MLCCYTISSIFTWFIFLSYLLHWACTVYVYVKLLIQFRFIVFPFFLCEKIIPTKREFCVFSYRQIMAFHCYCFRGIVWISIYFGYFFGFGNNLVSLSLIYVFIYLYFAYWRCTGCICYVNPYFFVNGLL